MKSVITISASLAISLMLCCTAQANDHKILGVIAMPRNETNDLALKLPVCRIVKRIQLSADHGDLQLTDTGNRGKFSFSPQKIVDTAPLADYYAAP